MESSTAVSDSCYVHSSSPLPASDQVQESGYSKSEVEFDQGALQLETSRVALKLEMNVASLELETNAVGLELETNAPTLELETALDLEMETDVPQGLSKQEMYHLVVLRALGLSNCLAPCSH
jgi:hypothetical protein